MTVLTGEQRRLLEQVVVAARDVVEAACDQRIAALGVGSEKAPTVLTEQERANRVGLRARARQLGSIDALVTEAGFEHWHRMLFARFLADNGLLVDDEARQPVSIEEVAEYASESDQDMWELAARFAAAMLPGIFLQDDPILAMRLPVETRQELEELLGRLPAEVITADDALGWVYQYWQSRRKDEVNKSERKIGGADLAPVTQLFTEDYMVRFLLENSLGAWWATRHPESPLLADWEYLRYNEDGTPAAGRFEEWPARVAEVTVMDPCCGSGHFLAAAFAMLWRMRADEEGMMPTEAQDAVLRDNLFGLELDDRCAQIATFALALQAWKDGGYRELPIPHVACSGIPAKAPIAEWTALADGDSVVEATLIRMHALFAQADTLGSLIDPVRAAEQAGLESVDWNQVAALVQRALAAEPNDGGDPAAAVFGHAAAGIARATRYLTRKYNLIATNVPYLISRRQEAQLENHLQTSHPAARSDLATAMLERSFRMLHSGGTCATVSPSSWLQLRSYRQFRLFILTSHRVDIVARLGSGAFRGISGQVVNVAISVVSVVEPATGHRYSTLDVSDFAEIREKVTELASQGLQQVEQSAARKGPDSRFVIQQAETSQLLSTYFWAYKGLTTGDDPRHRRMFWEIPEIRRPWVRIQSTPDGRPVSGCSGLVALGRMTNPLLPGVEMRGEEIWGRRGVHVKQMQDLPTALYLGYPHDQNAAAIVARDDAMLPALWAFARSGEYVRFVRAIDASLKVTNATLVQVPFDVERWRDVAAREYPDGLPEPVSSDPTQWIFGGEPIGSTDSLHVAVARLLGYSWPDQQRSDLDLLGDADGIVCVPAVGGEPVAAERIRTLLAAAYTMDYGAAKLDDLLAAVGAKPGPDGLERWLRDGFFKDHCRVFANRPFIWQIWDGTATGFSALVNYHRLDRRLLERITYDYLGNWWMSRVRDDIRNERPGAESLLVAAESLKEKLELILKGEPPYDVFVRWKTLAEQPIGWDPDLDDGVRMNVRPFVTAGVLRHKPNIKWDKDRGRNPDGSERINDRHFTIAEKLAARGGGGGR